MIKLIADYQCHPLWDASPGEYGDMDPSSLPISEELKRGLAKWAAVYDSTLNMDDPASSGFPSEQAEHDFRVEGERLAEQLQLELGQDYIVRLKI